MHVKDFMASDPTLVSPDATLKEAAQKMAEIDCGFLPVGTYDAIEGIITDRDIVIRAVARGKDTSREKVRDYMTENVYACAETDTLEDAAEAMNEHNVSRLVVMDDSATITGVLTFGKIIRSNDNRAETARVVDEAVGRSAA
jgi:CBS domain-containing protein